MSMVVKALKREVFGKNASRRIRKEGKMPAVLYGASIASVPLILSKKDVVKILKSESGVNTLVKVNFNGETRDAMIKDVQLDPISDELLHADLIQISMDKPVRVSVPVIAKGEPVGVKAEGGFMDFVTRQVEIECLPKDIPEHIELDVSGLHLHQSLKVADIVPPQGVRILEDPSAVIVLIGVPREEVVVEKPEEVLLVEEKEPEVIRKERVEEEEEKE